MSECRQNGTKSNALAEWAGSPRSLCDNGAFLLQAVHKAAHICCTMFNTCFIIAWVEHVHTIIARHFGSVIFIKFEIYVS